MSDGIRSDSWKGEHLIRTARKPAYTPEPVEPGICAHPGCRTRLHATSRSGVCRKHNHTPACRCEQCRGRREPQ